MKIIKGTLEELTKQVQRKNNLATNNPEVEASVAKIIQNVAKNGDTAVRQYEKQFDNVDLKDLRVPQKTIDAAYESIPDDTRQALELAKNNITSYHKMEQ